MNDSLDRSLTIQLFENGSSVSTSPAVTAKQPLHFTVITTFLYMLILLCSLFGNGMVIIIIACNRRIRTASYLLVMNLAACDLLTPLIGIPFDFAVEQTERWLYGSVGCKILYPATTLTSTASALILAVISLDRYRQIMHPFKGRLTKRQVVKSIIAAYIFSLLLVCPYIVVLRFENNACKEQWPGELYKQLYTMLLFLVQYLLPLLFMVFMYSLAVRNLYKASDRTRKEKITDKPARNSPRLQTRSKTRSIKWLSRLASIETNKRATKMFIMIVIVFAVFMFPNQVIWLWVVFHGGDTLPPSADLSTAFIACLLFTYTNSVVNPLIFNRMCPEFRRIWWKSLTRHAELVRSNSDPNQFLPLTAKHSKD